MVISRRDALLCSFLGRPSRSCVQVIHVIIFLDGKADRAHAFEQSLRDPVSRTERAPRQNQRLAEELLALRLKAAPCEGAREVARRDQRLLVPCAEQAGLLDEDLALDRHGLGVLALPFERERQVGGRD